MAVATDDDEDVEEMQGYRIGRIGSASCKEDRLDQMGSAAGTRSSLVSRLCTSANNAARFGRPALFPSSGKLMESYGVASRNCVQRLIAVDLETNIWPSLNFAPLSIPPAWLPHSSDKQDIGRSQNAC
ncbi:hypothetical protein OsI_19044 [Oryza sativa Indica Group]|uniref:Uncharacterized protein n=1 Tax=Oryza sativa subsp. indica TaxID=39946 RepID=A2Y208_ORYSI|nr:hypothetical protein OsI_19044 [Oryza sativa Indica Group]